MTGYSQYGLKQHPWRFNKRLQCFNFIISAALNE